MFVCARARACVCVCVCACVSTTMTAGCICSFRSLSQRENKIAFDMAAAASVADAHCGCIMRVGVGVRVVRIRHDLLSQSHQLKPPQWCQNSMHEALQSRPPRVSPPRKRPVRVHHHHRGTCRCGCVPRVRTGARRVVRVLVADVRMCGCVRVCGFVRPCVCACVNVCPSAH